MSVLLHGFSDLLTHELVKRGLKVSVWIRPGGRDNTRPEIFEKLANEMHVIKGHAFIESVSDDELKPDFTVPPVLYEKLRKKAFHSFLRCHTRRFQCPFSRKEFTFHEHAFIVFSQRCYQLIRKHHLKRLIFAQVPHKGADVILYHLAELMGLDTTLCVQTPAINPEYYTIVSKIEDIGIYSSAAPKSQLPIDTRPPEQKPFYTRRHKNKYRHAFWQLLIAILKFTQVLATFKPRSSRRIHLDKICRAVKRLHFLLQRPPISLSLEQLKTLVKRNKYIYAPLHLEPEMVIDILGGRYREQALFIMKLREKIPDEISIIVKENPAQTTYGRDKFFYETILGLHNVVYIREDVDTFSLIKDAHAVAAVLGTAGWEALRLGKPVITGGHAWYGCLPGVFHVDTFSYRDLVDFKPDPGQLRIAANAMSQYFRRGVLANFQLYKKNLPKFDEKENAQRIAEDIIEYISLSKRNKVDIGECHA